MTTDGFQGMSIYIFTDISERVGNGHAWRMMRLGDQLRQRGQDVVCTLPDNAKARDAANFIKQAPGGMGFSYLPIAPDLPAPHNAFTPFAPEFADRLPAGHNLYILDSYRLSRQHLRALRGSGYKILLLDDYNHRDLRRGDADAVLNPSVSGAVLPYDGLRTLSTPDYHLLPPAFFTGQSGDPRSLLLTFGGTDHGQIGLRLLESMLEREPSLARSDLHFAVTYAPTPENAAASRQRRIERLSTLLGTRFQSLTSFDSARLLGKTGMIICSAGQTALEARAAGVSFVSVAVLNESQVLLAKDMRGGGVSIHDLRGILDSDDEESPGAKAFLEPYAAALTQRLLSHAPVHLPPQASDGLARVLDEIDTMASGTTAVPVRSRKRKISPRRDAGNIPRHAR
jgi:spore coat polysaccharide biosynthesis predicted glycosyltransferase SpsG